MAGKQLRAGPLFLRGESHQVIAPDEVGGVVRNFTRTNEATLRAVVGPTPFTPDYGPHYQEQVPAVARKAAFGSAADQTAYGTDPNPSQLAQSDFGRTFQALDNATVYGVFHANVNQHDIYLAHVDNEIWWYNGWVRSWRVLIGPKERVVDGGAPYPYLVSNDIPHDDIPRFPTQFEATPSGVVIVPQGCRAYFFDGMVVAPLG